MRIRGVTGIAVAFGVAVVSWLAPGVAHIAAASAAGSPSSSESPIVSSSPTVIPIPSFFGGVFTPPTPSVPIHGAGVFVSTGGGAFGGANFTLSVPAGFAENGMAFLQVLAPATAAPRRFTVVLGVDITAASGSFAKPISVLFPRDLLPPGWSGRAAVFNTSTHPWKFAGEIVTPVGVSGQVQGPGTYILAVNRRTFRDLSAPTRAEEGLLAAGAIQGYPGGLFKPQALVSRAQVAAVLVRLAGLAPVEKATFQDVSRKSWYAPYVGAMAKAGWMQGIRGRFDPNATLTMDQLAEIVVRWLDLPVQKGGSVQALEQAGILTTSVVQPKVAVTRAQLCTILYDALQFEGLA